MLLLLLACRSPDKDDDTSSAGDSGDSADTASAVYVDGDCPTALPGWRCGIVTLPADHEDPTGDTVTLSVAVLPARSGTSAAPLALFTGGPGGSIFDLAGLVERGGVMAPLAEDHDIVLMSERGTFGATPTLDCPELSRCRETTTAFGRRCIPAAFVASSVAYLGMLPHRASASGRIGALGATWLFRGSS